MTTRLAGVQSIDPKLQLAPGVSVRALQEARDALAGELARYNQALAQADALLAKLEAAEEKARELAKRVLSGVATHFGDSSPEYEQAGGTRRSDRRRPGQRKRELAERKRPHHRGEIVVMPSTNGDAVAAPREAANGVAAH